MKNDKKIISHYLSISYEILIKHKFYHCLFFILEIATIFLQIIEIYYYEFNTSNLDNIKNFSPFIYLLFKINKLQETIKSIIYLIIIFIIIINYFVLNIYRFAINTFIKIIVNLSELFFYRLLSLFFFNYLFTLRGIFLL